MLNGIYFSHITVNQADDSTAPTNKVIRNNFIRFIKMSANLR